MSNIMEFVVKVYVYKHLSSFTLKNVPTRNLKHPIVYKTIRCWASTASSCHADTAYLVKKANSAIFIADSTINYQLKYSALPIKKKITKSQ